MSTMHPPPENDQKEEVEEIIEEEVVYENDEDAPISRRVWITAAIVCLVLLGGLAIIAKGSGLPTKIIRIWYPQYRVPLYPPKMIASAPYDGERNVPIEVVPEIELRQPNGRINEKTLDNNIYLVRVHDQKVIPITLRMSMNGGRVILQPGEPLEKDTNYMIEVAHGVKDLRGVSATPGVSSFTTVADLDPEIRFQKIALPVTEGPACTAVLMGPDHKLYTGSDDGRILRYGINPDGTLQPPQVITSLQQAENGKRLILGMCWDPKATADNLILWISNNYYAFSGAPDFSGKITRLRGRDLEIVEDVVVHLPRSARDHLTLQPVFGPDGALYVAQGASSAMGAPDPIWSWRPERTLAAAILRIDVSKITPGQPLDVNTKENGGTYDPFAPGAPLTIYAKGMRQSYDLVWHSNGHLYAPVNGSDAGGYTPEGPGGVPALKDVPVAEDDWLFDVKPGKYYGHPNPIHKHYVLNGGNPTAGYDLFEVPSYPVGVKPDPDWEPATYNIGRHVSANGALEYKSDIFHGKLKGALIICRYSWGTDLCVYHPDKDGKIIRTRHDIPGFTDFVNPLDVDQDPRNGNLYVSEYGAKRITLVRPILAPPPTTAPATQSAR